MTPRVQALAALLLAGCASPALVAVEPALEAPSVRVLVARSRLETTVVALAGAEPFLRPLPDPDELEVWLFVYPLASLARAHPELSGKSDAEAAALLAPHFGAAAGDSPPVPAQVARAEAHDGASS